MKINRILLTGILFLSLFCSARAANIAVNSRTGSYRTDGSFVWKYSCTVSSPGDAKDIKPFVNIPSDFPFKVANVALAAPVDSIRQSNLTFEVIVPRSFIKEPVDLRIFKLNIVVKIGHKADSCLVSVSGPLPQHPRLFIRRNELNDLKRHFSHSDFDDVRKVFNEQKSFPSDGKVDSDQPDERIRQKMEALALEYLLDTTRNRKSGKEAIRLAINYLQSYAANRTVKAVSYEENTNTYEAILGGAIVYDWCYGLLSDAQKTELFGALKKVCLLGEYGLPGSSKVQYLAGHYGECAPTAYLAIGLATYDEDPSFFDFEYNEQVNKFAPSRNPMYKAGTHHQGAQYIHVRYTHELLQHFMLNKLGLSPYDKDIYKAVYRAIYGTIPQKKDMDGMPEGDGHKHLEMGYSQLYYLAANVSKDPILQTVSRNNLIATKHQSARLFVYHNPDIQSKPMDSLCLSRFFPSPSGIMIARTKWDLDRSDFSSNAMVVLMNMKEYNAQNHTHLDGGHFGIYYKGHLAIDAGIYQGKDPQNGWAKLNHTNYFARTVAHNSLLIFDPNEPLPGGWDKKQKVLARDGGQFFFGDHAWDTSADMFKAGKSATILAEEISAGLQPDYSYFKGDLTNSYNVPKIIGVYPPKASVVRRSFVFLNHKSNEIPGTLIVLDKVVSTNASFKKSWLLHTQNEPVINSNRIVAVNANDGRNGKLIDTVLLPEASNSDIRKIGGPGKEYWCDGQNWGSVTQEDAGCWRVELSPRTDALADNFLNVLQAMDASYSPPKQNVSSSFSENKEYVIITVKDRIVAEQLTLGANGKPVSFTAGDPKCRYQVLVTDLKAGKWKVTTPAGVKHATVTETAGTLYFESIGGRFLVELERF